MNEKIISEKEIEENKKETLIKKILLLYIPGIIAIALAVTYLSTQKMIFLWIFGVFAFITIFGIDGGSRICKKCHKWGSIEWRIEKGTLKKEEIIIENAFGKRQKTYKKTRYDNKIGVCKNCKHQEIIEKKRKI